MESRILLSLTALASGLQLLVSYHLQQQHLYHVLGEVGQFEYLQWVSTCEAQNEDQDMVPSSWTMPDYGCVQHPDARRLHDLHRAATEVPRELDLGSCRQCLVMPTYPLGRSLTARFLQPGTPLDPGHTMESASLLCSTGYGELRCQLAQDAGPCGHNCGLPLCNGQSCLDRSLMMRTCPPRPM